MARLSGQRFRRRILLLAVVALAVLLATLIVAASIDERWLAGQLEAAINPQLQGRVTVARAAYQPPFGLRLEAVDLASASGEPLARLDRLEVQASPLPLLRRVVALGPVRVTGLSLSARQASDGSVDLAIALSPRTAREPASPWMVVVEDLHAELTSLALHLGDRSIQLRDVVVGGGSLATGGDTLRAAVEGLQATLELDWGDGWQTDGPLSLAAERIRWRRDGGSDVIDLATGSVTALGIEASVAGTVIWAVTGSSRDLDVKVRAALDAPALAPLHRLQPRLREATGRVELEARLTGNEGLEARGELRGRGLQLENLPAFDLSSRIDVAEDRVDARELRLDLGDGAITGNVSFERSNEIVAADLQLRRVALRRLLTPWVSPHRVPQRIDGRVELDRWTLSPLRASATVDLELDGVEQVAPVDLTGPVRVAGAFRLDEASLRVRDLRGVAGAMTVSGTADLGWAPDAPMQATVMVRHGDPASLWRGRGLPMRASSAAVDGLISGTRARPRFEGTVSVAAAQLDWGPPLDLQARITADDAALSIADGRAQATAGEITFAGALDWSAGDGGPIALEGRAQTDGLRLAELGWPGARPLGGTLRAQVILTGTPAAPVVKAEGEVAELQLAPIEAPAARFAVGWRDGRVVVEELVVDGPAGGMLTARGELTPATFNWVGSLAIEAMPLAWLTSSAWAPVALRGTLSATASGRGVGLAAEAELVASSPRVWLADLDLGALRLAAELSPELARGTLTLAGASAGARVEGEFESASRRSRGTLVVERLDLAALDGLWPQFEGWTGHATGRATLAGSLDRPELDATVDVPELAFGERGLGRVRVELRGPTEASPSQYAHRVRIDDGATVVVGAGTVDRISGELRSRVQVSGFDAATLDPRLTDAGLVAVVDAAADLTVSRTAGATVVGELQRLRLEAFDERADLERPAPIRWDEDGLTVRELRLRGGRTRFRASASLGRTLAANVDGQIEAAYLQPFVRAMTSAEGIVGTSLQLTGTPDAPQVVGSARPVTPVRLRLRGVPSDVSWDGGRLEVTADRLTLAGLTGRFGDAPFLLGGSVELDGMKPRAYDVSLLAERLDLRVPPVRVEVDVDLALTGRGTWPAVGGRVDVLYGRVERRFVLRDLRFVSERSADVPLKERIPWLHKLELELQVASRGPIDIQVDAGPFAVTGVAQLDVAVGGTAAVPAPAGWVAVESGQLRFPAGEIEIVSGTVELGGTPGGAVADAQVQLSAEGEIEPRSGATADGSTYLVSLDLTGTPRQLDLELRADPPLDHLEAMALLITGRPGMAWSESPGRGDLDYALALASGQATSVLTDYLSDRLEGLVNVRLQLSTELSTRALTIGARKRVNRRLRLEGAYQQHFVGAAGIGTARAQLLLTDRLFLEGQTRTVAPADLEGGAELGPRHQLQLKLRFLGD